MSKTKKPRQALNDLGVRQRIITIRRQRVIVDADLAALYGTSTKRLKEQLKQNSERFPEDFVFELTAEEKAEVVANCDHLRVWGRPALVAKFVC
jgi:hypothetical protein